jgi:hypothetical protein
MDFQPPNLADMIELVVGIFVVHLGMILGGPAAAAARPRRRRAAGGDRADRLRCGKPRGGGAIGWREHAGIGIPVTLMTLAIAAACLALRQAGAQ